MTNFIQATPWHELIRNKPFAVFLGLFSHFVLNNGEWEHVTHLVLSFWIFAFAAITGAEYALDPHVSSAFQALQVSATAGAVYFGTLATSVIIYRAVFHRLRKFPGPFIARISKFYSVSKVLPDRQYYKEIEKLHKQYNSDIIRTGSRELSITAADAVPLIHGPMTKCRKGPWYDGSKHIEGSSTHTTRDKLDHKKRRKAWDQAFSAKSLREYEPRVNRHTYSFISKLKEQCNEPAVRISNWINFYSFDVMGDIGFSRSFGMLEKGEEDYWIKMLHKNMEPLSIFGHIVWSLGTISRLGGVKDMLKFMAWTGETLRERKKIEPKEKDVFGWLLDPNDEDIPLHLNADSRLMIVAGSDTTAATLTWLFFELCKNPGAQAKLRNIIDQIAPEKAFLDADDLANCPHLDGVISEALRMHPAVPSGVQRETPPSGITLPNGTFIPGETLIWMPIHTMQRDERYFPDPLTFMPERWTDEKPKYIQDKRAFMPFGTGIYGCVGQKLAMMEMRSVTANLLRNFEMEFAEGEKGEACENETKDCFTLCVGKLDVRLRARKGLEV